MMKRLFGIFLIWNEANHPFDGIDSANDWVVTWYGGKGVKNADPTSIRFVNIFCNVTGWTDTVENWFNNLANYETVIDGLGIDHYPGTWAAGDGSDWYPLDWLFDFMDRYGKKGAICETGYSSWAWLQAAQIPNITSAYITPIGRRNWHGMIYRVKFPHFNISQSGGMIA